MQSENFIKFLGTASGIIGLIAGIYAFFEDTNLLIFSGVLFIGAFAIYIYIKISEPFEFKTLSNEIILDIKNTDGDEVHYTKKNRITALKNDVYYYTEDTSTDGRQTDYQVTPGHVESVSREEGKILIKTTFGKVLKKGETIDREFKCKFIDSFKNASEYWVQRQSYPSDQFSVRVIFPKKRPPISYKTVKKVGVYEEKCPQPILEYFNGKPSLYFNINSPKLKDSYKIQWEW